MSVVNPPTRRPALPSSNRISAQPLRLEYQIYDVSLNPRSVDFVPGEEASCAQLSSLISLVFAFQISEVKYPEYDLLALRSRVAWGEFLWTGIWYESGHVQLLHPEGMKEHGGEMKGSSQLPTNNGSTVNVLFYMNLPKIARPTATRSRAEHLVGFNNQFRGGK